MNLGEGRGATIPAARALDALGPMDAGAHDLAADHSRDGASQAGEVATAYAALRDTSAWIELARDGVVVEGPQALDYLQGQLSQDLRGLVTGASLDALVLDPKGKLDALVRVSMLGEQRILLDVDAPFGERLLERLLRFRIRVRAEIASLAIRTIGVRGPLAAAPSRVPGALAVAPVQWNSISGFDLLIEESPSSLEAGSAPTREAGLLPANLPPVRAVPQAFEAYRIEEGLPAMAAELDETTIPAEAGLVDRCVSFDKGCYTGQELTARLDARHANVPRRLRGIVFDTDPRASRIPGRGTEVVREGRQVGRLTSAAFSPGRGQVVGLAYLHRSVEVPCPVLVGGSARATAVALPIAS